MVRWMAIALWNMISNKNACLVRYMKELLWIGIVYSLFT